ncbi:MAG: VanZ family protein, partial [Marinicellaceae bacterium]
MQSSISRFFLSIIFLTILVFAFAPGQWTPAWVVNHDKFSHLIVFFFLGFMVLFSWPQISKAILLAGLVGFAVFIELLQFSVFNRGFSGIDLVYDFIGIG